MIAAPPSSGPRSRLSGRLQFLLLAVLFFAPFVSAWLLYFYFPAQRPTRTTNYGELVLPVRPLPQWTWAQPDGNRAPSRSLRGKWLLVQRVRADCDTACADRVLMTRQLRTALAADRDRVQRVLLVDDPARLAGLSQRFSAEHPDLLLRAASEPGAAAAFFENDDPQALFLIDPLGNYLMTYPDRGTQPDFKGMQTDMRKLLKLSHIG